MSTNDEEIPEIALTFQTVLRLRAHFGERVAILNSRMSAGVWLQYFLLRERISFNLRYVSFVVVEFSSVLSERLGSFLQVILIG
jgi:hypothetical protein